jgi:hypothetical protein
MTNTPVNPNDCVALWRTWAFFAGCGYSDAAYGFGGPDIAEAVDTADGLGSTLTSFLNSLGQKAMEATRLRTGSLAVRLEVEPYAGSATLARRTAQGAHEDSAPLWEATASVGNAHGVFDAAYSYGNAHGDEGHLLGSAQELGDELARVLKGLTHGDVEAMRYGTDRFYLLLLIVLPGQA